MGHPQNAREQAMSDRIRELEGMLGQKDQAIKDLQVALADAEARAYGGIRGASGRSSSPRGVSQRASAPGSSRAGSAKGLRSPRRSTSTKQLRAGSGLDASSSYDSPVSWKYAAVDREDPIDVRLEEVYNASGARLQFQRINRGFYRFGSSALVEMDIINHKLNARTEDDGWNRGKFGPVEKYLVYREGIERGKDSSL